MNNEIETKIDHISFFVFCIFVIMCLDYLLLSFRIEKRTMEIKHELKQIHEVVDNISKGKEIE